MLAILGRAACGGAATGPEPERRAFILSDGRPAVVDDVAFMNCAGIGDVDGRRSLVTTDFTQLTPLNGDLMAIYGNSGSIDALVVEDYGSSDPELGAVTDISIRGSIGGARGGEVAGAIEIQQTNRTAPPASIRGFRELGAFVAN